LTLVTSKLKKMCKTQINISEIIKKQQVIISRIVRRKYRKMMLALFNIRYNLDLETVGGLLSIDFIGSKDLGGYEILVDRVRIVLGFKANCAMFLS